MIITVKSSWAFKTRQAPVMHFPCVISRKQPHREGYIVIPILQKRKLKYREVSGKQTHSKDLKQDKYQTLSHAAQAKFLFLA